MINKTNITNTIRDYIKFFKNSSWQFGVFRNKSISPTYVPITSDVSFIAVKDLQYNNLTEYLTVLPKYRLPKHKDKTIVQGTKTDTVRINPNRRQERLSISQTVTQDDIPILMVDTDNEIIDTRILGGGLTKVAAINSIDTNGLIGSYSDIGRYGMPSAAASSIAIELPSEILNTYEESAIREMISKYVASGINVSIKYYTSNSLSSFGFDRIKAN